MPHSVFHFEIFLPTFINESPELFTENKSLLETSYYVKNCKYLIVPRSLLYLNIFSLDSSCIFFIRLQNVLHVFRYLCEDILTCNFHTEVQNTLMVLREACYFVLTSVGILNYFDGLTSYGT